MASIVWFRNDLRLLDNPALIEGAKKGEIIPLYIWDQKGEGEWPLGEASKWWLHHSLNVLSSEFQKKGIPLIIREGDSQQELLSIIKETKARACYWNRRYEPAIILRDTKIKSALVDLGIDVKSFNGSLLQEPWEVYNKEGNPFQVFTPFWKKSSQIPVRDLYNIPQLIPFKEGVKSKKVSELNLLPKIKWDVGLEHNFKPGCNEALKKLDQFLKNNVQEYGLNRDFPALNNGVSHLSPYLHFGEISPQMVLKEALKVPNSESFIRQLYWREFAYYLLYHFPKTPNAPLREKYELFPWEDDPLLLKKWQKGLTGYPIVDAGMRELWQTGWMHNRVRMIVGSFLVKDLLISWKEGAKWFWDTLVDADLANNTLGWQWVGGCGADAAPYFRIFNPVLQGEKFDPHGEYVKKFIPELKNLPNQLIQKPFEASPLELKLAGITLGKEYPFPIVNHNDARERALNALKKV